MQKTITIITVLLFIALEIMAQSPQGFNYQGIARDNEGVELANTNLTVQLSVLSGSSTGTLEWQETHAVTTNDFGLYNVSSKNI